MAQSIPRRDGPRLDLRLQVRYRAGTVQGEAEASDVSPRGLRLEGDHDLPVGTALVVQVDAGDGQTLAASGTVTWCRAHLTPTQRKVYDTGVGFDAAWAPPDTTPLGRALARVFAMAELDQALQWSRTEAVLNLANQPAVPLVLTDVSVGSLQFRSAAPLQRLLQSGRPVQVTVRSESVEYRVDGRVIWLVVQEGLEPGVPAPHQDTFGVELLAPAANVKALLERVRLGQLVADHLRVTG